MRGDAMMGGRSSGPAAPPPIGTPIGRVDAVWLRLRGALRIRPGCRSWDGPELWLRRALHLDPDQLGPADAECACIALESELRHLERAAPWRRRARA